MASKAVVPFLVAMMLLTGVCNTLLTKFQDNQCVRDCEDPDPKHRKHFEQPVLQTLQMFIGESGCWIVVGLLMLHRKYTERRAQNEHEYEPIATIDRETDVNSETTLLNNNPVPPSEDGKGEHVLSGFGVLLLALPSTCDICATTLMNVGLLMVAASIYQMTRGALVLFVGLFSVIFLRRKLHICQWLSLVGVVLGVAIVGLAGAISPDSKAKATSTIDLVRRAMDDPAMTDAVRVIIGVLLIAGAQIFTATQFVLEEWILERSPIDPIEVVGWEGLFGLVVTLIGMLVLHLAIGRTEAGHLGMFDMVEGFRQMMAHKAVLVSSFLIMISIGGFNFFGLSVTRSVSATSRSTIDTCRTLFIWIVSLGLGWESFKWLQVAGFALLVYFTFLFNGVVQPPFEFLRFTEDEESCAAPLLPEEPIEHN